MQFKAKLEKKVVFFFNLSVSEQKQQLLPSRLVVTKSNGPLVIQHASQPYAPGFKSYPNLILLFFSPSDLLQLRTINVWLPPKKEHQFTQPYNGNISNANSNTPWKMLDAFPKRMLLASKEKKSSNTFYRNSKQVQATT